MSVATVGHQKVDERPHAGDIRPVNDRTAVAGRSNQAGASQNAQVRRQRVVGAADRLGNCAGRKSGGLVAHQDPKDLEPGRLAERGQGWGPGDSYLLTRSLENTEPLSTFIEQTLTALERNRLVRVRQRLAREVLVSSSFEA